MYVCRHTGTQNRKDRWVDTRCCRIDWGGGKAKHMRAHQQGHRIKAGATRTACVVSKAFLKQQQSKSQNMHVYYRVHRVEKSVSYSIDIRYLYRGIRLHNRSKCQVKHVCYQKAHKIETSTQSILILPKAPAAAIKKPTTCVCHRHPHRIVTRARPIFSIPKAFLDSSKTQNNVHK